MRNDGDSRGPGDGKEKPASSDARAGSLLPSPPGSPHLPKDDPDAPPTEEERRAAAVLRTALAATEDAPQPGSGPVPRPGERSEEARWLAAHLRLPLADDSLGEVRARGLARAAREVVMSRRAQGKRRDGGWRQLGRSLTGTGGLLAAAAALLIVSWGLLDQGLRLQRGLVRAAPRVTTALMLRSSLQRNESPTQRLDLMMQERLLQLRAAPGRTTSAALASRAFPSARMLAQLRAAEATP